MLSWNQNQYFTEVHESSRSDNVMLKSATVIYTQFYKLGSSFSTVSEFSCSTRMVNICKSTQYWAVAIVIQMICTKHYLEIVTRVLLLYLQKCRIKIM